MASNSTAMAPVRRACDCCRRRKTRCPSEGTAPCKSCVSAGLTCTYNAIPQKKGPKGSRAKVLFELHEAQLAARLPINPGFNGQLISSTFARTQDLLFPALVEDCIEHFFMHVYPSEPILHGQRAQEIAATIERSAEAYSMIAALCAYVMIKANHKPLVNVLPRQEMAHMSNFDIGQVLLEESVRVRGEYNHREDPTHLSVLTLWFYSGSYFGLARENTAWTYLRDATTQAHLLGMHNEETYKHDPLDTSRQRALYWLLFIAERAYALHKNRPISLYPTICLPSLNELPYDRCTIVGLKIMIGMFKVVDETYVNLWNGVHNTPASSAWIIQVQTQLLEAVPARFECTQAQEVDIRMTQQWLRSQTWRLGVCQGLVSNVSQDNSLTYEYPIGIASDLLAISHQFSREAIEAHGVGLIKKLVDIAYCLIDVVACKSSSPEALALGPRDYVSRFLTLISTIRGGQSLYLPLLLTKLSEVLPNLSLPRPLNLPQTIPALTLGLNATDSGTLSNIAEESTEHRPPPSPPYFLNGLGGPISAPTGDRFPSNTTYQFMISAPATHASDLSLNESSLNATHSFSCASRSNGKIPCPYEAPIPQPRSQIMEGLTMELPASHGRMQRHHLGVNATAYDPRSSV